MSNLEKGSNVAVAFALVIGSSLSTGLGASAVFFPSIVKLTSTRVLASSLAFAAGVMLYVSFLEIIIKSQMSFSDAGYSEGESHLYSTICFFCGVICMMLVEKLVKYFGGGDHQEHEPVLDDSKKTDVKKSDGKDPLYIVPHCIGCSEDPKAELEEWHAKADKESADISNRHTENETSDESMMTNDHNGVLVDSVIVADSGIGIKTKDPETGQEEHQESLKETGSHHSDISSTDEYEKKKEMQERKKLIQMGASTALAIAIHNFPEGLATFVAALDDPKVGAVLAVALGIHNIPEGLCVALPVYYATGNRTKGFLWGLLSGLTEPIGALIGWLVLAKVMRDEVYAVLFGLVAGMMTYISFRELIPTAFRYDTKDTVVTHSTVVGMLVMAISLVLFRI